jgi:hypothetical protein
MTQMVCDWHSVTTFPGHEVPTNQWFGSLHDVTQEPFLQWFPARNRRGRWSLAWRANIPIFAEFDHCPPYFGSRHLPKTDILRLVAPDFC